ncbi:hypothetical protein [Bartonella sp. HY406]|uniref:hypothetical protein n=1 Tax=Bartonella sp. HY406 TaxID=2979331 RepID=UPI0021C746A5|nr:hypothetical protein [Bartonella sp. HY406]UXN04888.1 hypothetical protein N6B01_14370 [Bartonella sp. HY406]
MELDTYLEKINYGYDGIIRDIIFCDKLENVKIIATVRNEKNDWIILEIFIKKIQEGRFNIFKNRCYNVIYDGIKYYKMSGLHYINLDSPNTIEELKNIETFKESDLYFISTNIDFSIQPYDQNVKTADTSN